MGGMSRRTHPVPLLAGLLVGLVTILLGNWQMQRAADKLEIQNRIETHAQSEPVPAEAVPDPAEWQALRLRGTWHPEATIYLDNRSHGGRPGYHVLTPLRLQDGAGWVLVNRGWVASGRTRSELPGVESPGGIVELTGHVRRPEERPFTLADRPGEGALWQYIDLEAYRAWAGLEVRDWLVQQSAEGADGLVREWTRPDAGGERHYGYAFQWYALAALSFVLTGIHVLRRFRHHAP